MARLTPCVCRVRAAFSLSAHLQCRVHSNKPPSPRLVCVQEWRSGEPLSELHLPAKNPFIPSDFGLLEVSNKMHAA